MSSRQRRRILGLALLFGDRNGTRYSRATRIVLQIRKKLHYSNVQSFKQQNNINKLL
jgi:hypothetical protein